MSLTTILIVVVLSFLKFTVCTLTINGSISIHSMIFNKIINSFDFVLVKFDEPFSYGDKEDIFKEVSRSTVAIPNLITATVGVADYGDKENFDLAERYGIVKKDYPAYRLFKRDASSPIAYSGPIKTDHIKMFLVTETGVYIGLEGCLEEFDKLSRQFTAAQDAIHQTQIIDAMKEQLMAMRNRAQTTPADDTAHAVASAEKYVKIASKIQSSGTEFVNSERERLTKLIDGNISDNKKIDIRLRLNILQSFQVFPDSSGTTSGATTGTGGPEL